MTETDWWWVAAKSAVAGAVIGVAMMTGASVAGLRINVTASMPRGLWRVHGGAISRGATIIACPPDNESIRTAFDRGYIAFGACPGGYEPLIKTVAAIEGDAVLISRDGISVNGVLVWNTMPLPSDTEGRPLASMPIGKYRVQPGEIWILANRDWLSFDSRYFGPVLAQDVQGIANPIWVWP